MSQTDPTAEIQKEYQRRCAYERVVLVRRNTVAWQSDHQKTLCFFVLIWAGNESGSIKKTPTSVTTQIRFTNTWRYSYIEAHGRPAAGCRTWTLNRSEDATAPCPQVQPLARLSTFIHRHSHWHTYITNAQIQTQLATLINTNRTCCLILFPSVTDQDEGLLVGNTHTHMCTMRINQ